MASIADIPPEILVAIFEWVQSYKDLLNIALASRSWADWAIDARWRTCNVPISQILNVLNSGRGLHVQIPDRDADDSDWNKFITVSNKVTRVNFNVALPSSATRHFEWCRNKHPNDVLFQNVRKLIIHMSKTNVDTVSVVCSSASPKTISMFRDPPEASSTWDRESWLYQRLPNHSSSLANVAPAVEEIFVDYAYGTWSPRLSSFVHLRVLRCRLSVVYLYWWRDLATCQSLTNLDLRELASQGGGRNLEPSAIFQRLETFYYKGSWRNVLRLIASSALPALTELVLQSRPPDTYLEQITLHLKERSPGLKQFKCGQDSIVIPH